MMQVINTKRGDIEFEPQEFILGSKIIDKEIAKENLLEFQNVMDRNSITFSLAYGTLLGAIRESDFISHDEDIDVAILDEDRDNFLAILDEFIAIGFTVGRYANDLLSLIRNGEYIDIYIFRKRPFGYREFSNEKLKESYLIDRVEYNFMDSKFYIPKDYERYLIDHYGKDWKVPIKDYHACNPNLYLRTKNIIKNNSEPLFKIISFIKQKVYVQTK